MTLDNQMIEQLRKLRNGDDIKSSDRASDKARTKLKKLGLIEFDRTAWLWKMTPSGWDALMDQLKRV